MVQRFNITDVRYITIFHCNPLHNKDAQFVGETKYVGNYTGNTGVPLTIGSHIVLLVIYGWR